MTDHDTHRLIGELRGALNVLSRLVEALDTRHHDTHGAVSEMRGDIANLTKRVDALTGPVTKSSIAEARHEAGDQAVAAAAAQRNDVIRTVISVTTLVAAIVSSVVGYLVTRNGGYQP